MPIDLIFNNISNPIFLVKPIALIVLVFYFIFSLVVLNQVRVMNRIETVPPIATILLLFAILHAILVFSLFLTTVVIL